MIAARSLSGRPPRSRQGFTLIELSISAAAASVLMLGLAASIFLGAQALSGTDLLDERAEAAQVQQEMLADLSQARQFTTRTATSATFTVPDRDADGDNETITWAWSGAPANELQYTFNGGPTVPLLTDVQNFSFDWSERLMTGAASPPPAMDPDSWGFRWQAGGNFGYEELFGSSDSERRKTIATRVTLDSEQTVVSLTAWFAFPYGGNSDIGMALYGVDHNDNPKDLIASTTTVKISTSGWHTLPVPAVTLPAGEYYLALSHKSEDAFFRYSSSGGETHVGNTDALKSGWPSTFPNGASDNNRRISIYGSYQ